MRQVDHGAQAVDACRPEQADPGHGAGEVLFRGQQQISRLDDDGAVRDHLGLRQNAVP